MGRVTRKKVKSVESVPERHKYFRSVKSHRSKAISIRTVVKEDSPEKSVNVIRKQNKNVSSSFEVIKIEDSSLSTNQLESMETDSSSVCVSNITSVDNDIIDITDTTFVGNEPDKSQIAPSKEKVSNTEDDIIDITDTTFIGNEPDKSQTASSKVKGSNTEDDIIDITDTTFIDNEYENSKTVSSNGKIPFCDDVQFVSHTHVRNNPIEIITLSDDSDEENTSHQQSNKKPIEFKSIKERLGVIVNSKNKAYNSPLRSHKRVFKDDCTHKQETLPNNLGAFVIDKQRISHHSLNINKFEPKIATFSQPHKSSSSVTSQAVRKLRPIIIDGLNIGHAHGLGTFSVKGIDLCVKYFADRGHTDIVAFIPQHRQGPPGSESNTILNALVKKGHICYTPSRKVQNLRMTCHDDRIILNYANRCSGVVVSNDNYRDLYDENEAFKEIIEQRQVMVTFVRDEIIVPDDQYNRRNDVRSLSDILCFSE